MAHRFDPKSSPKENLQLFLRSIPLKLLVLLPLIAIVVIPTYIYAAHAGSTVIPSVTNLFYNLSNGPSGPTPTPMPAYSTVLPRVGSIAYTVQNGDNCDEILALHMNMYSASEVFSDANPVTVTALNQTLGLNCHRLQPGMPLKMSPQYPLMAFGGVITKVSGTAQREVLPTPLIPVPGQQDQGPDCSQGCQLAVRIASGVSVNVNVSTTLSVKPGSWIWTQAALPRKTVKGFANYPYVDPNAPINGMTLQACDFQVNDTHDDNSTACSALQPNTIVTDGGAWLVGVMGPAGLSHWHYKINAPLGTQVLAWLSLDSNGNLSHHAGDPVYRYDTSSQMYVKL
jgi:hypothetical protein